MKVEWLENNMLHLDIKNILNQFEVRDEWICNLDDVLLFLVEMI